MVEFDHANCPMGLHYLGIISNCSLKTVVGVRRPVNALTCLINSEKKNDLVLKAENLSNIIFSQ